jgi:hypothetical protein
MLGGVRNLRTLACLDTHKDGTTRDGYGIWIQSMKTYRPVAQGRCRQRSGRAAQAVRLEKELQNDC